MTYSEYELAIDKLTTNYGKSRYQEVQVARVWHYCKDLPIDVFRKMVVYAIDNFEFAPGVPYFKAKAQSWKAANNPIWQSDNMANERDNKALKSLLKDIGAKSLVDAVRKGGLK